MPIKFLVLDFCFGGGGGGGKCRSFYGHRDFLNYGETNP